MVVSYNIIMKFNIYFRKYLTYTIMGPFGNNLFLLKLKTEIILFPIRKIIQVCIWVYDLQNLKTINNNKQKQFPFKSILLKTGWVGSWVDLTQPNIPTDWHELTRLFLWVKKSWVGVQFYQGLPTDILNCYLVFVLHKITWF